MLKYAHSQDKKQSNLFAVLVNFLVIEMLDSYMENCFEL